MLDFLCLSLTPAGLEHPGLAVAAARAGGVAVLDCEFCGKEDLPRALANTRRLLEMVGEDSHVGLRLRREQLESSRAMLELFRARAHWLILCAWDAERLPALLSSLPHGVSRTLLLEVTSAAQLSGVHTGPEVHGLLARGQESGGWVGDDSAFILSQKLLAAQSRPVYVQGGIGIHSAAACLAAGAAGVVLDDQLLLMPESPLPARWQSVIGKLGGQEAVLAGERFGAGCRFLSRPDMPAAVALQKQAERFELERAEGEEGADGLADELAGDAAARWRESARGVLGWGPPDERAWPLGQSAGMAAHVREKYGTTGRFIRALLATARGSVESAARLRPLSPEGALAASHGTLYPVVQGPMTRVSDTAGFADAVASAGALPLLALALMKGDEAGTVLRETSETLGARPWGVGILGFVPQELREQQIRAVVGVKPPFALIAGGRPEQAAELEAQGIATYIHVPTKGLLKSFLSKGARRFVFEGRECGGHVGPLTSFALWDGVVETLLEEVKPSDAASVHVLFAGGIHDAASAAMVSALAAPLAERGVRVGVLMGTAYLFTREAVARKAIAGTFQEQALSCDRTVNLETGPGHAIRCVNTPFSREFYAERRRAVRSGVSQSELKETLESLTVGRLRLASKGLKRDGGGRLLPVGEDEQLREGIYMIGQVATMRDSVQSMEELHLEVSEASARLLQEACEVEGESAPARQEAKPSDVAIVGVGLLVPGAQHPSELWDNVLGQVNSITEIPPTRWDWRLYFDPERKARDRFYSRWGGFIDEVPFDPLRFGIPPNSLKSVSTSQLLTLEAVRRALEDAGYPAGDFDREHTSVILGCADGGSAMFNALVARTMMPLLVESPGAQVWDRLPEWTEESFPGTLTNVAAGRVANRFDLGGANFTVDAACASSLAAIDVAVAALESGSCNVAVTGGADFSQTPYFYIAFSKNQALSPKGRARTFDKSADGIVISEGAAVLVLKRLADAERDGDRVYAVIKAVASSSDGKALGLTAPRPVGQMRAVERAKTKAGVRLDTLGLYEAHGTGTVVGDQAELETIVTSLKADDAPGKACAIGSVKTLVGHTKISAGVVGLTKAALSLYHKTLPPHGGVDDPLDAVSEPGGPVYLLKEPRAWLERPEHPRRGGVSAFGFGGTNTHAILEEYRGDVRRRAPGAEAWPFELLTLTAETLPRLREEVRRLLDALDAGARPRLRDLAYSYANAAQECGNAKNVRLSIVAESVERLREDLALTLAALEEGAQDGAQDGGTKEGGAREGRQKENGARELRLPPHVLLGCAEAAGRGSVAFLFPGQGAQHTCMAREVALYFDEMRGALEYADAALREQYPKPLSQYVYPPAAFDEAERRRQDEELTATHVAQPAIGAVSAGFLDIAGRLGLVPSMVCGHSYGEYTALYAAGALAREDFTRLSEARGRAMAAACGLDGTMAVVRAPRAEVTALLSDFESVVVANHNAPRQTVISGTRRGVGEAVERLKAAGLGCNLLRVAGPFHSPLMESARAPLEESIAACAWRSPSLPVYSNVNARPYERDAASVRGQVSRHLLSAVEFVGQIEQMYSDGARVFVELGPKNILTGLTGQILEGRPHLAVSAEGEGGGLRGFLLAAGKLYAHGVGLDLPALFDGRDVRQLDLSRLAETTARPALPPSAWLVDGGGVRLQSEASARIGKLPFLNREDVERAQSLALGREDEDRARVESRAGVEGRAGVDERVRDLATVRLQAPPVETHARSSRAENATPSHETDAGAAPFEGGQVVAAYQAYQETMRQFLSLQEEALKQFLGLQHQQPPATQPQQPATTQLHADAPENAGGGDAAAHDFDNRPKFAGSEFALGQSNGGRNGGPHASVNEPAKAAADARGAGEQHRTEDACERAPAAAPSARAGESAFDRAGLTGALVHIVSERTGYPDEMLGLELDMEAELGIDSIKRIEILEELQRELPAAVALKMQERAEQLTRVKTLGELIDSVMQWVNQNAPASPVDSSTQTSTVLSVSQLSPSQPTPVRSAFQTFSDASAPEVTRPSDPVRHARVNAPGESEGRAEAVGTHDETSLAEVTRADGEGCPRSIPEPHEAPLGSTNGGALGGLFVIAEDALSVARLVADSLRRRGARAAVLDRETLASPEDSERAVGELRRRHGPIRGVVHLAALCADAWPDGHEEWRRRTQVESKSLFQLLRACAAEGERPGRVLSASLLGGLFGRGGGVACGPGLPTGGSGYGLLKTLEAEWPGVHVKAVDFDVTLSAEEIAGRVVEELCAGDGRQEVGYPSGRRTIFRTVAAPLRKGGDGGDGEAKLTPAADWVVLVTGGARGITAEVALALAVGGMKMIVLGRSPAGVGETNGTACVHDAGELRRILAGRAKNGGPPPTPAYVESELRALLRGREIRRNLARLEAAGVSVEYRALDVRDAEGLGALIAQIYARQGRIDAVLHGAGVIEDKLIGDKTRESFDRVFDTKVDSAFVLSRKLRPDSLKLVALFGSVAGRYGNRGQSDYAAANEVLNRFAWRMAGDFPSARVVAINWGPWDSSGMASEAVNRQFRERGIIPLTTAEGCGFFMDEIRRGGRSDAEVIAGDGPWAGEDSDAAYDFGSLLLGINDLSENFRLM